jgi:hypothetical protein
LIKSRLAIASSVGIQQSRVDAGPSVTELAAFEASGNGDLSRRGRVASRFWRQNSKSFQ